MTLLEHRDELVQGIAGIKDILDNEDIAPGDIGIEILCHMNGAGGGSAAAVAGNRHEINIDLAVDLAHQVGNEYNGAIEDPDDEKILALVVLGDLLAQPFAGAMQLHLVKHYLTDVLIHSHGVLSS